MIKTEDKAEAEQRRVGRPRGDRVTVTVRLDPDIRAELMKDGRGFGDRLNTMLRRALKL